MRDERNGDDFLWIAWDEIRCCTNNQYPVNSGQVTISMIIVTVTFVFSV